MEGQPSGQCNDGTDVRKLASEIAAKLATSDARAKESMAFMLVGTRLEQYGIYRLDQQLASTITDDVLRAAVIECAFVHMRNIATQSGFHSETLLGGCHALAQTIREDIKQERKCSKDRRNQALVEGITTPFQSLDKELGGGLKAGKVVLVSGESRAVYVTLAGMYKHFVKHRVPMTHYGVASSSSMPEVPGVKNIPGAFWRAQGSNLFRMKDIFDAGDGYVFLVDRLDWLLDSKDQELSDARRRSAALKYLVKMARRFKVGIVVGHDTSDEELIRIGGVTNLPVCVRTLDGKEVFMAGDEIFEEKNDGLRFPGRNDCTASGLGEPDGGADGPSELEGSGKDRGEKGGVGGVGAGE